MWLRSFLATCTAMMLCCASPVVASAQDALIPVKVAEGSRNFNALPMYIALQFQYFEQNGLKAELTTLKGGPAAASALLTKDVDFALTLAETTIKLRQQDKWLKVAAVLQDRNPCVLVVPTASAAKNLADLKGKSIGVSALGSLTDVTLRGYMAQQNLSPNDFKIVAFGQPATVNTALERGDIDAAVTVTPFLTSLELNKTARAIVDFRGDIYPGQSVLVRNDDLQGPQRQVIDKFVLVMQKGMDTLYSDKAAVITTAKAFFPNVDENLLSAAIEDDTVRHRMFAANLKIDPADFIKWQNDLIRNQVLTSGLDYAQVFVK